MEALFGEMSVPAKFVLAFVIVLGLIGIAAFLMRRFSAGPLSMSGPRGRQPRLAVIDAANVDGRRRLVLIRRDNTEHLLMIGGPTDIVVEPNIVRAVANAAAREPRPGTAAEALARQLPTGRETEPLWPQAAEPMPRAARSLDDIEAVRPDPLRHESPRAEPPLPRSEPPLRPLRDTGDASARGSRGEPGGRMTAFPAAERYRAEPAAEELPVPSLTPVAPEPVVAPEPRRAAPAPIPASPQYEPVFQTTPPEPKRAPAPPVAPEPALEADEPSDETEWPPVAAREPIYQSAVITESKRAQTTPPAPRPSQSDESNLAEMAQRLEAALRRPIKPVEPVPPPPVRAAPAAPPASRVAAYFETPAAAPTPAAQSAEPAEPAPEPKVGAANAKPAAAGTFSSLEEEMASLLGRSSGKT